MPDPGSHAPRDERRALALPGRAPAVPLGSGPLRAARAGDPRAAARAAQQRAAQPSGWWGMALFLCAEATLFGGLIATYFYLDFGSREGWPPAGIARPATLAPSLLTAILVATSLPVALAARRARAGARSSCMAAIAVAMAVQSGYAVYQLHVFVDELHKFAPQGSAYGSIYYTLLGVHLAHVIVGVLLSAGTLGFLARAGLTNYRLIGVRSLALYWHVVNALAVAVLLTQLSPSL
jgi:heme/copper-type cytochrome/quinol oxidase subunit 3